MQTEFGGGALAPSGMSNGDQQEVMKLVPADHNYTLDQMMAALDYAKKSRPNASDQIVKALAFDICGGYVAMVQAYKEKQA